MLESGPTLRTWRLENPPQANSSVRATSLGDHRIIYLEYEGEISGGRGSVTRWDQGEFEWLADEPGMVQVILRGGRVAGRVYLCKGASDDWSLRLTSVDSDLGDPTV